mmetsp:Transcript_10394/g.24236  ORF Transcript_10394/g.24236 Transcript_10394/m.24236 type:complete len:531 (+) Transcript_10394:130-1722(+)
MYINTVHCRAPSHARPRPDPTKQNLSPKLNPQTKSNFLSFFRHLLPLHEVLSSDVPRKTRPRHAVQNPRAEHALKHRDSLLDVLEVDHAVLSDADVHDVVGDVPPGLVHLLLDVEAGGREDLGDVREHARLVLCADREADGVLGRGGEGRRGEVDRVADGAGLEVVADGLGGHGRGGVLGLAGGGAEVGDDDGVGVVPEYVVREVGDVPPVKLVEVFFQRVRVHELPPREVKQHSALLHGAHDVTANNPVRATLALDVRYVERDVVRVPHGVEDAVCQVDGAGQLEGRLDGESRVVAGYRHAEGLCVAGRGGADVSESDDREGLSLDFPPAEEGLVLLDPLLGQSLLAEAFHVVDPVDDPPRSEEHAGQDQLLDGVGVRPRRVEDRYSQLAAPADGHVVGPRAAPRDGADRVGDLVLLELVTPEQDRVGVGRLVASLDLVLLLGKLPQAVGADLVERLDLELARGVGGGVAVGLPLASAVLDGYVREGGGSGGDGAGGEAEGRRRPTGHGPHRGVNCRDHVSASPKLPEV